jgi:hypothetical protein
MINRVSNSMTGHLSRLLPSRGPRVRGAPPEGMFATPQTFPPDLCCRSQCDLNAYYKLPGDDLVQSKVEKVSVVVLNLS